ncbi:MAG TPA: hypothetical protein VGO55_03480 [Allosphingosinicella sp.]|nr:hypothetical protein [Allosphingosinicella sp.]
MRTFLLLAALCGCATAQAPAPAPAESAIRVFRGDYAYGFEQSRFDGCWLNMSAEAWAEFERRQPESAQAARAGGYRYEIAFEGRREEYQGPPESGFGHMGLSRCRIEAIHLLDSRLVLPTPDRLPPRQ